ncbi:MAG: diaminopimelate dehydrogenase [Clostridia bacterium]|nr:diaminopimelate dehydrogenase [Clostridia bacterium]
MKIAIAGYGNLGKAALEAALGEKDVSLVGVFSRRNVKNLSVPDGVSAYPFSQIADFKGKIDVVLNCMGSARDLPKTTPFLASFFNVVDSFDTHARIKEHFEKTDSAARKAGTTAIVSVGWDPGLFSLSRLYMKSVLAEPVVHTFWGKGVSQGHTDAIREIDGVLFAREYTVPVEAAVEAVRNGKSKNFSEKQLHRRICYVVPKENADTAAIESEIKNMPEYFKGYETTVNFITLDEFLSEHQSMAHAGNVIGIGRGKEGTNRLEFSLFASSNPELTARILLAFSKACVRLNGRGEKGCKTVFDVRPSDLLFDGEKERFLIL